jgi:hypothetical protein
MTPKVGRNITAIIGKLLIWSGRFSMLTAKNKMFYFLQLELIIYHPSYTVSTNICTHKCRLGNLREVLLNMQCSDNAHNQAYLCAKSNNIYTICTHKILLPTCNNSNHYCCIILCQLVDVSWCCACVHSSCLVLVNHYVRQVPSMSVRDILPI